MENTSQSGKAKTEIPFDLKQCVEFHGHLCPGLVYGYIVAKESIKLLDIKRSIDEEVVTICENDSCAVDGLQVMIGTTAGKGNLIIKDYGKNAYTVINRFKEKAFRFSRITEYNYSGKNLDEFNKLEKAVSDGTANEQQKARQKYLKAVDLFSRPFNEVFYTKEIKFSMPPYAPLAPSVACAICGEMTMKTKMAPAENGKLICIPCSNTKS